MEFPFNHGHHNNSNITHTHHHNNRRDDNEETLNYPPPGATFPFNNNNPHQPPSPSPYPPFYGVDQPSPPHPHQPETQVFHTGHVTQGHMSQDFNHSAPPPFPTPPHPHQPETQVFHTGHVTQGHVSQDFNHSAAPPPPPQPYHQADHSLNYGYPSAPSAPPPYPPQAPHAYTPPAPPNASVHHVSHETHHVSNNTQFPSSAATVHHVSHQSGPVVGLSNKSTVRVVTKAAPNYSLTIRHGKVILAPYDPRDEYQHWYKDEKYSTRVKDSEGCPAFSLVNKVTGEAIKHSIGATHPVRLIPYNPDFLDESVLWTESRDLGDGHRAVRMVNNIRLNVDAYHGDKNSGGVHEGTTVVLWEWNKGDNQRWKILPYCKFSLLNTN